MLTILTYFNEGKGGVIFCQANLCQRLNLFFIFY